MTADDYADLARHAEAFPPNERTWHLHAMDRLFVGPGEPGNLDRIVHMSPDTLSDLTVDAARDELRIAEFIAAANPATILRLIADLHHARSEWHRHNERADQYRGQYSRAVEERDRLREDAAHWEREYDHASRRYDEIAAERDAVAQDLAQVATERRNIRHNAVGLLRARDRLIAERDALAARLAAVEALADEWERRAQLAESTADARAGLSDEVSLRQHAVVMSNRAADLRAVLSAAPTDTTKETP